MKPYKLILMIGVLAFSHQAISKDFIRASEKEGISFKENGRKISDDLYSYKLWTEAESKFSKPYCSKKGIDSLKKEAINKADEKLIKKTILPHMISINHTTSDEVFNFSIICSTGSIKFEHSGYIKIKNLQISGGPIIAYTTRKFLDVVKNYEQLINSKLEYISN